MRKNLALLLACSMMLGLTACGGGGTETTAAATEAATQAPAETPAAAEGDKGEGAEAPAEGAGDMEALIEAAKAEGIHGKDTTPFLLAKIKDLTGGDSLASNIQLVFNNARLAAKTAAELSALAKG